MSEFEMRSEVKEKFHVPEFLGKCIVGVSI